MATQHAVSLALSNQPSGINSIWNYLTTFLRKAELQILMF